MLLISDVVIGERMLFILILKRKHEALM